MSMMKTLRLWPQFLLPKKGMTYLFGKLASIQQPTFKNWAIRTFLRLYPVNLIEAADPHPENYRDFNAFFIRHLKKGLRPLDNSPNTIVSPVDGHVSALGKIANHRLIQAKGRDYRLQTLLGDNAELAKQFVDGHFITLYLAPEQYHRVHMPVSGELQSMHYFPGHLFSVNQLTASKIQDLFAQNERVCCLFNTAYGPMAIILVGAMLVGGIATVWQGDITPPHRKAKQDWQYANETPVTLQQGEEMGHFKYGSTVILLFADKRIQFRENLTLNQIINMGQGIANGN